MKAERGTDLEKEMWSEATESVCVRGEVGGGVMK